MSRTATRTTAQVVCPMHQGSCGQTVEADFGSFSDTTVSVVACDSLLKQGWTGPQWVGRKSYALTVLDVISPETTVTYRDGLVAFTS